MHVSHNANYFFDKEKSVVVDRLLQDKPLELRPERQLVVFITDQTIDCYVIYYFLFYSNCTILMLDSKINVDELKKVITAFKPNYIISPEELLNNKDFKIVSKYNSYVFTFFNESTLSINENLKFLLPTSGTTGKQKFVKLTIKNIISNANDIKSYLDIKNSDIAPTTMPLAYSYGMSIVNSHLIAGCSIFVNRSTVIEKSFLSDMNDAKITNLNGVPAFWEFADRMDLIQNLPRSVRLLTQAGGKLSQSITEKMYEKCIQKNVDFFVMYGQTECSPRMAYLNVTKHVEKIGSIGRQIDSGRLSLKTVDLYQGKPVQELVFCGPNVGMGYSNSCRDLWKGDEWKGQIDTGDIGVVDSDGFYYVTGRLKRICKMAGTRIDLDVCQNQIREEFENNKIYVVSNDKKLGVFSNKEIDIKKLKLYLTNKYNIFPKNIKFILIEDFPKNNGKVLLGRLEDRL